MTRYSQHNDDFGARQGTSKWLTFFGVTFMIIKSEARLGEGSNEGGGGVALTDFLIPF